MPRSRRTAPSTLVGLAALTALTALAGGAAGLGSPAAAADPAYSVTTLHFEVTVGPQGDRQTCDVVGDLYVPADASAQRRVPGPGTDPSRQAAERTHGR